MKLTADYINSNGEHYSACFGHNKTVLNITQKGWGQAVGGLRPKVKNLSLFKDNGISTAKENAIGTKCKANLLEYRQTCLPILVHL